MSKIYYLPRTESGRADWLDNLSLKLPTYETILSISNATPLQA